MTTSLFDINWEWEREKNKKNLYTVYTRKKIYMFCLQALIAALSIGSSSGKCLLSMVSWHGLTGSRVPHEVIAPRSGEVMSSNPGQLYNWPGGQWGDMELDNEALELQCRSGWGGSYVPQTAQRSASSHSHCNKRCHRFPLKLTYGLSWQPWTHEDVKTF